jgi:hypothetical protein
VTGRPSLAEIRAQTAEVIAFLRGSCPVCLIPHNDSIHAATLRIRKTILAKRIIRETPLNKGALKFREKHMRKKE